MSKFLVNDHGTGTDPSAFHQHAGNDLFNFAGGPGHEMPHGASWTNAVELDIHSHGGAAAAHPGWTHQVESNVVVIDNHHGGHHGGHHGSPLTHAASGSGAANSDPAHSHLDKIDW
jgi:hypothetical protein